MTDLERERIRKTVDFIKKAEKLYTIYEYCLYDYSKVKYYDEGIEVEIICFDHGSFMMTPYAHVECRKGCWECEYENSTGVPVEEFPNYRIFRNGKVMNIKNDKDKELKPYLSDDEEDKGYLIVSLKKDGDDKNYKCMLHRLIAKAFIPNFDPKKYIFVDHRDGVRTNNHIQNLRWFTVAQNSRNRKKKSGLSSRFWGVSWNKKDKIWSAFLTYDKNKTYLGRYNTELEAANARDIEAKKYPDIHLNFINGVENPMLKDVIAKNKDEIEPELESKLDMNLEFKIVEKYPNYRIYENKVVYNIKTEKALDEFEKSKYSKVYLINENGGKHISIHKIYTEAFSKETKVEGRTLIDHINGDKSDNRLENLRRATYSENSRNVSKNTKKSSSSIYKGVNWVKRSTAWRATIRYQKENEKSKKHHIGQFDREVDAAIEYDKEALTHHKEFANINFPIEYYYPLTQDINIIDAIKINLREDELYFRRLVWEEKIEKYQKELKELEKLKSGKEEIDSNIENINNILN